MAHKRGPEHHSWKGEDIRDTSLHVWIRTHFERPDACEHCGKPDDGIRHHHWCRKDHRSLSRDRDENWLYLCASCHARYDRPGGLQRISDTELVKLSSHPRRSVR